MDRRTFISVVISATAWPFTARAQQPRKIPTVGVLWHAGSADEEAPYFEALVEGFKSLGYTDGLNIKIEHRFPNETPANFKSMAYQRLISLSASVERRRLT